MKSLRVAVIGCGTAGPAAAHFLADAGHRVEIFERAPELLPVGTGFILQPTGLWVLSSLGLREEAERYGARLTGLHAETHRGRVLLDFEYARLAGGVEPLYGLGMHRATLLSILTEGLAGKGVVLHLGVDIDSVSLRGRERVLAAGSQELAAFDLVVVANGAHSTLRDALLRPRRSRAYPWGALWSIQRDPTGEFRRGLHQVVEGTHTMLGLLPSGRRRDDPSAGSLVSVFFSAPVEKPSPDHFGGADALWQRIESLEPRAAALERGGDWGFAGYMDVVLPRLYAESAVVLGDAAHAMSPQLGQGVNLALFDARVLARCIAEADDLGSALLRFDEERRRHLSFYQYATRWLTPFFQSHLRPIGPLRDLVMPWLGRSPFLDGQALRAMSGLKTGWFASLPLEDPGT